MVSFNAYLLHIYTRTDTINKDHQQYMKYIYIYIDIYIYIYLDWYTRAVMHVCYIYMYIFYQLDNFHMSDYSFCLSYIYIWHAYSRNKIYEW